MIKILKHLISFSNKILQLKMNCKITHQLKIQRKKLSTLISLISVTLRLKFSDWMWQTLIKLKLRVSLVKFLIKYFFYDLFLVVPYIYYYILRKIKGLYQCYLQNERFKSRLSYIRLLNVWTLSHYHHLCHSSFWVLCNRQLCCIPQMRS